MAHKKFKMFNFGMLENEDGVFVAKLLEGCPSVDQAVLTKSGDMYSVMKRFVEEVESGTMKPKKAYDSFKKILDEIH